MVTVDTSSVATWALRPDVIGGTPIIFASGSDPASARFFGGAHFVDPPNGYDFIDPLRARVYTYEPTIPSVIGCVDARRFRLGFPVALVFNNGASSLEVEDAIGGTIGTIPAGDCGLLACLDNSTPEGSWSIEIRDANPASI